jgi:hypothetical protein
MAGNIAEVVANDPHIVKIIPSEYSSVPEVDESFFRNDVDWMLDLCKRFLGMPYVIDNFEDHENERKPWSHAMYKAHGRKFWDYAVVGNALKRGSFVQLIGGPTSIVDMLAEQYCGPDKEEFEALVESVKQKHLSLAEYDFLPNSVKALHVRHVKKHIYGILKFCEKQKVFQEAA